MLIQRAGNSKYVAQTGAFRMAWETRARTGRRYYYRAQRVNGRVRKICYGNGFRAAQAAREDVERRAVRAADVAAARAGEMELLPLERLISESDDQVDLLLA